MVNTSLKTFIFFFSLSSAFSSLKPLNRVLKAEMVNVKPAMGKGGFLRS